MHQGRRFQIILALGAAAISLSPRPAQAIDRDVRSVIVAGEYGLVGGSILGLATLPFSQNLRTVFIGSSVGLYLGIVVGFYYIYHRDDPDNPLRQDHPGGAGGADWESRRGMDPGTREGELRALAAKSPEWRLQADSQPEPIRVSVAVYRF